MQTIQKRIDLHVHSHYSDGTLSPRSIMELARKRGIAAVAITDHDTMEGTAEALAHGREQNVEVISGVEISAQHDNIAMHILGYGLDHQDPVLQKKLTVLQDARNVRNKGIISKLENLGVDIDLAELTRHNVGQLGRPHIAKLLQKKGVVRSINQAFFLYLRRNGPAYVESYKFPAAEAISIIQNAGGLAFLAHPACIDPSLKSLPRLLHDLKILGLDGIELYYPNHSAKTHKILKKTGEDEGLLFSGGSDFHGDIRKDIPLGGSAKSGYVPYDFWLLLLSALKSAKTGTMETP